MADNTVEPGQVALVDAEAAGAVPVCGIVMPISEIGTDYSGEHWQRVKRIIERAVEKAGFVAQLVWENSSIDIIQAKILKNIYENDVVVCDVSGLNPNVMLELGLRLSTKRPTIIVTDREEAPPFDVNVVEYLKYPKSLEYNAIDAFIEDLSVRIKGVHEDYRNNRYQSFVSNFRFETVTPQVTEVSENEFLNQQVVNLSSAVNRLEKLIKPEWSPETLVPSRHFKMRATISDKGLRRVVEAAHGSKLVTLVDFEVVRPNFGAADYTFTFAAKIAATMAEARLAAQELLDLDDDVPF